MGGVERLDRYAPGVRRGPDADVAQLGHHPAPGRQPEGDDVHQQDVEQPVTGELQQQRQVRGDLAIGDQRRGAVALDPLAQRDQVGAVLRKWLLDPEQVAVGDAVEVGEEVGSGVAVVGVDEDLALGVGFADQPRHGDVAVDPGLSRQPPVAPADLELEGAVARGDVLVAVAQDGRHALGRVLGVEVIHVDGAAVAGDGRLAQLAEHRVDGLAEDDAGEVMQGEVQRGGPLVGDADGWVEQPGHRLADQGGGVPEGAAEQSPAGCALVGPDHGVAADVASAVGAKVRVAPDRARVVADELTRLDRGDAVGLERGHVIPSRWVWSIPTGRRRA